MLMAELDQCTRTEANWPMVVMTLIIGIVAVAIFVTYRLTHVERLRIMMRDEQYYDDAVKSMSNLDPHS